HRPLPSFPTRRSSDLPRGVRTCPARSPRSPCEDRRMTCTSPTDREYATGAVKIAPRGSSFVTYENGEMSTVFAANPNGAFARSPFAGFRTLNSTGQTPLVDGVYVPANKPPANVNVTFDTGPDCGLTRAHAYNVDRSVVTDV